MKIIHTADLHLDSPLVGVKDPSRRRRELIGALSNLGEYAKNNGIGAIIVAGDLFDEVNTTDKTIRSVADVVKGGEADWFVLRGNHGGIEAYDKLRAICPQINFFGDDWTTYTHGNVAICGRELGTSDAEQWAKLTLDKSAYNILVLHGDVDDPTYGLIDKKAIAASNASYVALGHRHTFAAHKFGRVNGCYSGVLEPRGFDETADTGFILIDTDTGEVKFVTQAIRKVVTVNLDVGGVTSEVALRNKIQAATAEVDPRNYLNMILSGAVSEDLQIEAVAREVLADRYFALRIKDATTLSIDVDKISQEVSLRGEFVKLAKNIPDERLREAVLKMGLNYLHGEVKS